MPALKNTRREAYCQNRAKGMTKDAAYKAAGFSANRSNAVRTDSMPEVQARIAELQAATMQQTQEALKYDAISIFKRIDDIITEAREAGDHKVAMEGAKFIAKAFGYEDHPTLTHEQVNKQTVDLNGARGDQDGSAQDGGSETPTNVTRFNDALRKYKQA